MIIVQLKGGLGNQLFQYAAALHLGIHHNVPVKVDISLLNKPDALIGTSRFFDLLSIYVPPVVATTEEIKAIKGNKFVQYLEKICPPYRRKQYKELDFSYDSQFLNAGKNIYLKGYRQSEKYFSPISDYIKNVFSINKNLITEVLPLSNQMQEENSVAVHIRRGDYKNIKLLNFHGVLELDYYQKAISRIQELYPNATFYFFSDDIDWVKSYLPIANAVFIDSKISSSSISDFHLISSCQHQIIANSTFSWWAAYLNKNPNKTVIAPQNWFNKANYNTQDLYPQSWIKI